MDLLSKIVSGNIDRVKRNISNSFVQDVDIEKGFDDELEKGKWNVGDTKVYQGVTWEVGGFNAKGAPLWRKAKGGAGGGNNSLTAKTSNDSKQSTPTSSAPKKSDSSKQTDKNSSFVTKTIDEMKKVLKWKSIPDDEFEKLADAISNDEETAKNILSIKFPEAEDVSPKSYYSKDSKTVDIGDYYMVCQTSKRFEYTYRSSGLGMSPNITTEYYIALKDPKIRINRWMGNSSFSTLGYNKQPKSEAKKQCIMLALYNFYKDIKKIYN